MLYLYRFIFRHISKFKDTVKDETKANKDASKTMGPAKVQTRAPNDFLRKHEKEPKLPESKITCTSANMGA